MKDSEIHVLTDITKVLLLCRFKLASERSWIRVTGVMAAGVNMFFFFLFLN